MFDPKSLLGKIYNAPPIKKKHKKPRHDGTNNASPLAAAAAETGEGQEGPLKKASVLQGYTEEVTTGEMSEPRARAARQKGQLNFGTELKHMLHAYGDPIPPADLPQEPIPETVRVLDEIVTDFIIETCHSAAAVATHSGRQKVKADDFHFMLRDDPTKLGRVQELIRMEKELKEARKVFDQNDDRVGGLKETGKSVLEGGEEDTGEGKEGGKKAKGKKGKAAAAASDAGEGASAKKRKRKE